MDASTHKDAYVRTTIDLPDELLRQVKARAALDGLTLKDLIARYVTQGLVQGTRAAAAPGQWPASRQRSLLPVIAKAATGKPILALSRGEIAQLEVDEDSAMHDRSAGR